MVSGESPCKKQGFVKQWFLSYGAEIKRFLSIKYRLDDEAEDIVQDAFKNLLDADDLDTIEDPKAYLYTAARNLALNRIRRQTRHNNYVVKSDRPCEPRSPEYSAAARKDLDKIENSLGELPEKGYKAFVLSRVHHKTYKEISQELNVSVSAVEKYIIQALQFLKERVGRDNA